MLQSWLILLIGKRPKAAWNLALQAGSSKAANEGMNFFVIYINCHWCD
jgi:hypothetical protein